ncbi:hypothetical protein ACH4C6_34845 [Streptomyces sp. NPDC017943]|uniref:hypothetical protein n=1 Tax=Streptomyces TaxID=1883 RepID=UPI0034565DA2
MKKYLISGVAVLSVAGGAVLFGPSWIKEEAAPPAPVAFQEVGTKSGGGSFFDFAQNGAPTVFKHDGWLANLEGGNSTFLFGDEPSLSEYGFNDTITMVSNPTDTAQCFFEHDNYGGRKTEVPAKSGINLTGNELNDTFSSMKPC